jgi:cytochrome c oxidase assembly factor CtaG
MLSFLMAKASTAWYPAYEATAAVLAVWGRAPLDDQRLGSLIMWVTATPIYMIAWLIPLLAWQRKSERKVPAEQDVLLLDSDLWNSSEWRETYRDQA